MINGCKESSQFSFTTLEFIVIELSHIAKLELVFQCLLDLGVTLNLEKTTIGFSEGRMVGHIVSKNGVATDPEKFDKISKLPFPTTKKPFKVFFVDDGLLLKVHTHVCGKSMSFNTLPMKRCTYTNGG